MASEQPVSDRENQLAPTVFHSNSSSLREFSQDHQVAEPALRPSFLRKGTASATSSAGASKCARVFAPEICTCTPQPRQAHFCR